MLKIFLLLLLTTITLSATIPRKLVSFKIFGTDRIQVLPGKQSTDDLFRNFAFNFPSEQITDYMVPSGVGTFMNISYANLFLRLSIDHSFLFIVTDYCKNCDKNILLNVSHSLTGDIYTFESGECWSNSFVNSPNNVPLCEVNLNYGKSYISGTLGFDTIYLTAYAKSFPLPNIIYLGDQDNNLVNSDINGVMGLGTADTDGAYGISVLEEFLSHSVMETPLFSMCLEPIGDGYLFLSAYGNGSLPFDEETVVWFEQTYSYMFTVDVQSVFFGEKELSTNEQSIQFTLNTPYLLLSQDMFKQYSQLMQDFLCNGGDKFTNLCSNAGRLLLEENSIVMKLKDAAILKEIPSFTLKLRGKAGKSLDISIQKTFAICPSKNKDYFLSTDDTEIPICSIVRLNKEDPRRTVLGNIAHTAQGNLYIFDKRRGLLGISQEVVCYPKPTQTNMVLEKLPMTYSLVGQIFLILGFCTLLVLSLNKCDEYFYQEEDGEGEEGASLNFLTHSRSHADLTDQNISRSNMR